MTEIEKLQERITELERKVEELIHQLSRKEDKLAVYGRNRNTGTN